MLSTVLHDQTIRCKDSEFQVFRESRFLNRGADFLSTTRRTVVCRLRWTIRPGRWRIPEQPGRHGQLSILPGLGRRQLLGHPQHRLQHEMERLWYLCESPSIEKLSKRLTRLDLLLCLQHLGAAVRGPILKVHQAISLRFYYLSHHLMAFHHPVWSFIETKL